ncbi:succinate dehydrogenase assembly factor 3 [Arctopsyche grandis]|uniref:succinate dehydrogenase assembly factor 3 n=1 Tax=Arctopsyche grandis TaxID=121162 RepID=UPI00406D9FD7
MSLTKLQSTRMLYKAILRLHRGLPLEMKALGDEYVKAEFKRHKKCSDAEANLFMNEWTDYAITLSKQLGLKGMRRMKIGSEMDPRLVDQMRDEQVAQLYELMKATKLEENG